MLVGRRRHEEREIISAAFSKWVRVTMFDMDEGSLQKGSNDNSEVHKIRQKWQAREYQKQWKAPLLGWRY